MKVNVPVFTLYRSNKYHTHLLQTKPRKTSKSSEEAVTEMKAQKRSILKTKENGKGLTIGGYGEAVYSHNFYSDKYIRYTAKDPSVYKGQSHGRFDLPHVVLS